MTIAVHTFVAALLWSLLAVSVALTFVAVLWRSWRAALLAALMSLGCAIAALFSIGILVLLLTLFQALLAVVLYRSRPAPN